VDEVRTRVQASIQAAECTWLNLDSVGQESGTVQARLSGVAGDLPAAMNALKQAAGAPTDFDTTAVSSVGPRACSPLDAFRAFREPVSDTPSLAARQREFRIGNDPEFCGDMRQARVDMDLRPGGTSNDFTLLALEPTGRLQQLISDRAQFQRAQANVKDLGGDTWQFSFCVDQMSAQSGLAALVLVKGMGPFSVNLDPNSNQSEELVSPADWARQFVAKGQAQRWTTQVTWYRIVDR